jgi:Integrase core domain
MIAGAWCMSRSRSIRRPRGPFSSFETPFSWDQLPRYLLRDRDDAFDHVHTIGVQEVLTLPGSPWQNANVERFIGSVRRECLDHVIVLTTAGLCRVLKEYVAYYSRTRTHLGLDKDAPLGPRHCLWGAHARTPTLNSESQSKQLFRDSRRQFRKHCPTHPKEFSGSGSDYWQGHASHQLVPRHFR